MNQTTHFFNLGYGWLCKHCSVENSERKQRQHQPGAQKLAFAKWVDEEQRCGLICPRCGIDEFVNKPRQGTKFTNMKSS